MTLQGEFRLGFLALSDAAPLIVADRRALFSARGLEVTLSREVSWATARDKLAAGLLDGAHMLASLALASRLGLAGEPVDFIAPLGLNVHGAAVTLAAPLAERLACDLAGPAASAAPLQAEIADRRRRGAARLTFGVVFAISTHAHLLRDWLAAGGIDPDRDVRLRVLPPTALVGALAAGELDGFCVGAPWNAAAEASGVGRMVLHAAQMHAFRPDKVFAVKQDWAERNGAALDALLQALAEAAAWADDPANRPVLLSILSDPGAVGAAPAILERGFADDHGAQGRLMYSGAAIARPDREKGEWLIRQLRRWDGAGADDRADGFYRPDLYDRALGVSGAEPLGAPRPA